MPGRAWAKLGLLSLLTPPRQSLESAFQQLAPPAAPAGAPGSVPLSTTSQLLTHSKALRTQTQNCGVTRGLSPGAEEEALAREL